MRVNMTDLLPGLITLPFLADLSCMDQTYLHSIRSFILIAAGGGNMTTTIFRFPTIASNVPFWLISSFSGVKSNCRI